MKLYRSGSRWETEAVLPLLVDKPTAPLQLFKVDFKINVICVVQEKSRIKLWNYTKYFQYRPSFFSHSRLLQGRMGMSAFCFPKQLWKPPFSTQSVFDRYAYGIGNLITQHKIYKCCRVMIPQRQKLFPQHWLPRSLSPCCNQKEPLISSLCFHSGTYTLYTLCKVALLSNQRKRGNQLTIIEWMNICAKCRFEQSVTLLYLSCLRFRYRRWN